jgi:hypothetical protein
MADEPKTTEFCARKSQNNLTRDSLTRYILVSSIADERVDAVLGAMDSGKKGVCFSYTW